MRTYNFNAEACGYLKDSCGSALGRSHHPLNHPLVHNKTSSGLQKTNKSFLSQTTRFTKMSENLSNGLDFIYKQKSNLNLLSSFLSDLKKYNLSSDNNSESGYNLSRFYSESLSNLVSEKFLGHPLFGYGFESPIKIQIYLDGLRTTLLVPIQPLLSETAFSSISLTLSLDQRLCPASYDEAQKEILNLLLDVEERKKHLSDFQKRLKDPQQDFCKSSTPQDRIINFIKTFGRGLLPRFGNNLPRPIQEIPI